MFRCTRCMQQRQQPKPIFKHATKSVPRRKSGRISKMNSSSFFDAVVSSTFAKFTYIDANETWSSASWNWGYANGSAHDYAKILRTKFLVRDVRELFVENFSVVDAHDEQEMKLIIALCIQREQHEGDREGWSVVLKELVKGAFEAENEGSFKEFCSVLREKVGGDDDDDTMKRTLVAIKFLERGP